MITSCVRRVTIINFEIALGFTTVCFIHGYLSTTFTVSFFLLVVRAFNKAVRNLISLTCLILPRIIQRTRDAMITLLLCQHDVATSFWRNNDVISTSHVRWVSGHLLKLPIFYTVFTVIVIFPMESNYISFLQKSLLDKSAYWSSYCIISIVSSPISSLSHAPLL